MTEQEFGEQVVMELKRCSMMTYTLTRKNHRKFKRFFLKKAKRNLDWNNLKRRREFDRLYQAFNVTIGNGTEQKER